MWVALDIAIGLITIFLLFAIVVSGINEWFAHLASRRGAFLRLGLQRMLGDDAVYRRLLHHPLVGAMSQKPSAAGKPPSYIDPAVFATALADVLLRRGGEAAADGTGAVDTALTVEALRRALRSPPLQGSAIAVSLLPVVERAGTELHAVLAGIEHWFNSAMDRVSGWYKVRTRYLMFLIGLALAALCNVDTIEIARVLSRSPELRGAIGDMAATIVRERAVNGVPIEPLAGRAPTEDEWTRLRPALEKLREHGTAAQLPIGWDCLGTVLDTAAGARVDPVSCRQSLSHTWRHSDATAWLLKFAGWLLTAMAGAMGAGYWFNLLGKAINLRSAGPKPLAPMTPRT